MRWSVVVVAIVASVTACSDKQAARDKPDPVAPKLDNDAGVRPLGPVPVDPGTTMHLDDDAARRPAQSQPVHVGKPVDIILRSTPSSAQAAVDGVPVGQTPAYWYGMADGREHEFTFVLADHAVARYRFVPITSGVIHARLTPVGDDVDAGVPPAEVVPPPADAAIVQPPLPPPTFVTPVDAGTPVPDYRGSPAEAPRPVGPQP